MSVANGYDTTTIRKKESTKTKELNERTEDDTQDV